MTAVLTRVFSSERVARLRWRRFSFWRFRFFWLLMFATRVGLPDFSREPGEVTSGGAVAYRASAPACCDILGFVATPARMPRRDAAAPTPPDAARSSGSGPLSIIAHIDHGKSTLADRILELCGAVDPRDMREQYLDSMDLERERGITIKAQNVRLTLEGPRHHLIDTPGHVDFGYEVSRSLAACEGVILLVDASQGIEAQTLANCYAALDADLTIVAALNKIDLPQAEPDKRRRGDRARARHPGRRRAAHLGQDRRGCARAARRGASTQVPPPKGDPDAPLQALIFDSYYDAYRGVVSAVRVFDGTLVSGARLRYLQAGQNHDAEEIGVRLPVPTPVASLGPGEVGYLIAGIKDVGEARVGETVTTAARPGAVLPGYRDPKPMVFCGLYPVDGDEYADLREALEKLRLNDSSFTYEPETSGALGFGFRCGFLGLLHMEIVRERLEREYDLSLVATAPNVEYVAHLARPAPTRSSTTRRRCRRRTRSSGSRSRTSRSRCSRRPSTSAP